MTIKSLPATINVYDINVARARLPETYKAAKMALAECQRIDECKVWSDKAQAIAAYARMAKDDQLYNMAVRIQARAIRRVGELLGEFKRPGARTDQPRDGSVPRSEKEAADDADLPERQRKKAISVAKVSQDQFDAAVEGNEPMTAVQIADLNRPPPKGFQQATHLLGGLRRFAEFCDNNQPQEVAHGLFPQEVEDACRMSQRVTDWLEQFSTCLIGENDVRL